MMAPKISTNAKGRMEFHLAYKKQMKRIILSFFGENIEAIYQLNESAPLADIVQIIDQWVDNRFSSEPDPRWKDE